MHGRHYASCSHDELRIYTAGYLLYRVRRVGLGLSRNAMKEKAGLMTEDYRLTLETAHSIIQRSVEMAAIIRSGSADLRDDLMEDAAYRYYFEKADALEE